MTLPRAPQRITPSFAFSYIERSIQEGLTLRKFGRPEMDEVLRFFFDGRDPECVYCGSEDVRRWDHLVPVMAGGDTIVGNMVLACSQCDDSKQATEFEQWMTGDAPRSPLSRGVLDIESRVERIREYVRHHNYVVISLIERLDRRESDELKEIRERMADNRRRLELLIADHRARV